MAKPGSTLLAQILFYMLIEMITSQEIQEVLAKLEGLEKEVTLISSGKNEASTLFTVAEACKFLHVSTRTLQTYRDGGLIRFSQVGSKIFFRRSDIDEFLARHDVKPFNADRRDGHGK
jgi:excisionase family DNA binding protein